MLEQQGFSPEMPAWVQSFLRVAGVVLIMMCAGEIKPTLASKNIILAEPAKSVEPGVELGSVQEIPVASNWSRKGGYQFNDPDSYVKATMASPTAGAAPITTYELHGAEKLCQRAPGSPLCEAEELILSAFGIPEKDKQQFLSHAVVVPNEMIGGICGSGAAACINYMGDSYTAVYMVDSVVRYRTAQEITAHENIHEWAFEGTPGDGTNNLGQSAIVGQDNIEVDQMCEVLTVSGAQECSTNSSGEVSCINKETAELKAVVGSRLYMIQNVSPLGALDDFAIIHTEFLGGYGGPFESGEDIPGYLTREETRKGIHILLDYFLAHPHEAQKWRQALFKGDLVGVMGYESRAFTGILETPERIIEYEDRLNSALKVYSGMPDVTRTSIIYQKSIKSFCGVEK